jgi:hypothetical protein
MILLIVVWMLSLLYSAVMFTLGLLFGVTVTFYVSCVTGIISCIGIFYTGNILIRIKNAIEKVENNDEI